MQLAPTTETMSMAAAAQRFGCCPDDVVALVEDGDIEWRLVGDEVRVTVRAVEEMRRSGWPAPWRRIVCRRSA